MTECKHNTTDTLASWAKPRLSIEACTWCDEILVSVIDDNGVSHVYTVPELTALRQALAAADKILTGPLQGYSSIDMAAYRRAKALAEETAHDEPAALRERVAELEAKLLTARHWLLGIHADLYPDKSGDVLSKFSTDEIERLEAFLNELGQVDLGELTEGDEWVCDSCGQQFDNEVDMLAHQFNSQCEKDLANERGE